MGQYDDEVFSEMAAENGALRAENKRLREVLKPVMKENFPDYFDDGRVIPISVSCGAIRAARAAMGESDE